MARGKGFGLRGWLKRPWCFSSQCFYVQKKTEDLSCLLLLLFFLWTLVL